MRIAILQGAFFPVPPIRGGAVEKLWDVLGREFAARGHEVVHVSRLCNGLLPRERDRGVRHIRVRGYDQPRGAIHLKFRDLLYSWRACRLIPDSDVVVTNSFWSPLLLRKRRGVYVCVERMPKGQMRLYRSASRLHACSSAVLNAIIKEDPSASSRVVLIPNPLPHPPARAVDWRRKKKVLLFAGRLHPEKGIEMLLAAFREARLAGKLSDWRLILVGPVEVARGGGGEAWINALLRRYGAEDLELRPAIYDADLLNEQYEIASVFVYPSIAELGETFGVAPLEAMAWGAVPLVSALDCFRDFIEPGENGIVFNHRESDPIARLAIAMTDAAEADLQRLGEAATCVRQTHSSTRIADLFLEDFAAFAGDKK